MAELTNTKALITPLPFDSKLFNYPVGKLNLGQEWNEQEFLEAAKDYQLIYLFSDKALKINNPAIQLVDIKVTFQKSLANLEATGEIQKYESDTLEKELVNLAYLSGIYSRFKIDPRLKKQEFEMLYTKWISSAFEKEQVLVAPQQAGMVTYAVEKDLGRIGLIAVSEKHQGKGWGKKLVKAAEHIAQQEGAKEMLIPTQQTNIPACNLYQSLGYIPAQQVNVYHWWNGVSLQ